MSSEFRLSDDVVRVLLRRLGFDVQDIYCEDDLPAVFGFSVEDKSVDHVAHSTRCTYAVVEETRSHVRKALDQLGEVVSKLKELGHKVQLVVLVVCNLGEREGRRFKIVHGVLCERRGGEFKPVELPDGLYIRALDKNMLRNILRGRRPRA